MKNKKKQLLKTRCFTLLEVMVAIAILAVASGAILWRIDRMLDRQRFESDVGRLQGLFHYARALAINTQADWQFQIAETKEGCKARLFGVEDPERSSIAKQPSPLKKCRLFFDNKPAAALVFDFFSTGQVAPKGVLKISMKESKREFLIPELFRQAETQKFDPLHP